jgi:hypothetical protein
LREGELPVLPDEEREEEEEGEEGLGSLCRSFLYYLELGVGETLHHHLDPLTCELGGEALKPIGRSVPDYP